MLRVIFFFIFFLNFAKATDLIEARCGIFDLDGSLIKSFGGSLCGYRDDGSFLRIYDSYLEYINPQGKRVWKNSGLYHHDFKFDQNQKDVLVLEESKHDILGCMTRFDVVRRYDLATGKLLQTMDLYDYYKAGKIKTARNETLLNKAFFRKVEGQYMCGTTHVNSISQIEENDLEKKYPEFKKGNWLLHLGWSGLILVFDSQFKEIVGQHFIDLFDYRFHDVQLTKEGKLLVYVNNLKEKGKKTRTVVALIDPLIKGREKIKIFPLIVDGKSFHQNRVGGVQFLKNDQKLVSIYSHEKGFQAAFFDKNWKVVKRLTFHIGADNKGQDFQTAKVLDLGKFLKNYQGD